MNFSVILNTRKRPMHLDSAIDSLFNKALDPDNVDVWVKYDNDDETTDAYVKSVPFDIKKVKFFFVHWC